MPSSPAPCPLRGPLLRPVHPGAGARVLAVLLLAAVLLALLPEGSARGDGARWRWPVPSPHTVLAPFQAPEHRYGSGHRGIDIAVPEGGAPVRAVEAGTVRFSGTVAGRGVVSVRHADGLLSTYEPVHGLLTAGSRVEAGEVLGTLETGAAASHCTAGDCLHLGARRGEVYLDPLPLLGARGPSVLLPWAGASRDRGPAAGAGAAGSAEQLSAGTAHAVGAALARSAAGRRPPDAGAGAG